MKILNFKKTIKNYTWATMLLIGALAFGITSCSDDDSTDVNPDGQEAESAWMTPFIVSTPEGFIHYLTVTEEIPEELDLSNSVELGLNANVISFNEHPYVTNGNAKTITKWKVDRTDLSLSVEGILSFASTGIVNAGAFPIFVSETQAFLYDLKEGLVVEWNPEDMTIIEVYQFDPLVSIYNPSDVITFLSYLRGDKIFIPVWQLRPFECCNITNTSDMGAIVAVFDVNTKTLAYEKDTRLMSANSNMILDENGSLYVPPGRDQNSLIARYFDYDRDQAPSPHTLLKFNDDGTFDTNFSLNLDDVLDIELIGEASFVFDNKVVFTYYDSRDAQLPPTIDNWGAFRTNPTRQVAVDLATKEVEPFTAFENYDAVAFRRQIDGVNYYLALNFVESGMNDSFYLRQDSFDSFTEIGAYTGATVQVLGKLW